MPVKEKQDHFTIEQVAKDLKLGVEEVKQLIMKGGDEDGCAKCGRGGNRKLGRSIAINSMVWEG